MYKGADIVLCLARSSQNLNHVSVDGETPLILAARRVNPGLWIPQNKTTLKTSVNYTQNECKLIPDIVRVLLGLGADPNVLDKSGRNASWWAREALRRASDTGVNYTRNECSFVVLEDG